MDNFYFYGSEVKATDNGIVKGYAIRFGSPTDTDLEYDYFTPETDFGRPLKKGEKFKLNLYYHHGQDDTLKSYVIGSGIAEMDDKGIWFEAQLNLADNYGAMINELVRKGKLGYSSGSASHLVEREKKSSSYFIKSWPIAEISLTPSPAEPRNKVIKSMKDYYNEEGVWVPKRKDEKNGEYEAPEAEENEETEEMVEGLVELGVTPEQMVDTIFSGYDKEIVAEAIHELYRKMCEGLYAILEEGNNISYVNTLIEGFALRAMDVAERIYNNPENEMIVLKLYSGNKPETVRDLEKRLRDVGFSNNQSKSLAGICWSHLRDVNEDVQPKEENKLLKQQLLKKAMLQLLG